MNQELTLQAKDIPGPIISGVVSIQLSELDQMRADHAKLKQIATNLEAQQMEVKVTVQQLTRDERYVPPTGRYDRGRYVVDENYRVIETKYYNLTDVREIIREEEMKKVEEVLTTLRKEVSEANEKTDKANERISLLDNFIKELKSDLRKKDNEIEEAKSGQTNNHEIERLKDELRDLNRDYKQLKIEKTFWAWLQKRFN